MPAARGATQPGFSTAHIWMISFAVLWLVATGLLVWVYTDQEKVVTENDDLRRENTKLISPNEKLLPHYGKGQPGVVTVVGLLEQDRARTAELASGQPDHTPAAVKSELDAVVDRIRSEKLVSDTSSFGGASAVGALRSLYGEFTNLHTRCTDAENQVRELTDEVKSLADASATRRNEFDAQSAAVAQKLDEISREWERLQEDHRKQIAEFEKDLEDFRQDASRNIKELSLKRDSFEKDLTDIQQKYSDLRKKLGELQITPVPLQTLRQPDGLVLTAKAGEDVVYINLGQDAQLTLGLQFAVYSPDTSIPADGQSKARVEVVSIYERTSACKIVEKSPDELILEGDLIANPIYDRSRPLIFLVLGEFDLNHDNRMDPDGAAKIKALIENWGGRTTDTVSARLDFIVVGSPPREPRVIGEATAEVVERNREITRQFEEYTRQLETANSLSIPVLTPPVFLRFLGYRETDPFPQS
ncbi:MAG: hypothetical protein JXB13_18020 [Phycisphaerae bacterium]|nr:hypothetical protein [Phycisphaerae bacterium]